MTATDLSPPEAPGKGRLSLEAIQDSRRARSILGLALAVAVIVTIYAIVLAFTGRFTNLLSIPAELPAGSNAIPIGAPVQYRNVTVGKVASETAGPNGSIAVKFQMYPGRVVNVPKGVEAQVAPLSIFGNQYVNLVPPATIGAGHLEAGDSIAPYTGQASTSLQGTVTQLYNLLNAVHPADLNTALTAFATALNGEGIDLGKTLDAASQYSTAILPHLQTLEADLRLLDPFTAHLEAATPDLLSTLNNTSVTAQTITSQAAQLKQLLSTGKTDTGHLADLFQKSQSALIDLMNQSGPLLSDVTANPNELSLTLQGLGQWAAAWSAAESQGPYLSVNANLPIADISAGVNAALGYNNPASLGAALGSAFNPATYTSSNCPVYPGGTNPYCGVGGSPAATPVGSAGVRAASTGSPGAAARRPAAQDAGRQAPATPYAAELNAVDAIAASMNGGESPPSPGVATVILYSLLASMSGPR